MYINIIYNLKTNKCSFNTDIKRERISDVLSDFLRLQIGAGVDNSPSSELEEYHINLTLDLSDDTFYVDHDCGNLGLRDGILMLAVRQLAN